MADPGMVGKAFSPGQITVERGKIRELALAIGDDNPLYRDKAAAVAAGFRDVVAPPTYGTVLDMWGGPDFETLCRELSLNPLKVLHGEQEYQYFGQLCPGDEITIAPRVTSVTEKGGMWLVVTETTYTNQLGELVLKSHSTIVERK